MQGVASSTKILDRTIFLDSFSKSHGLCSERLGIYFSSNETLFRKHHSSNIAFSAGPGVYKDFQFMALGNMSQEDKNSISDLHEFWRKEREGVYKYLMKYNDLFEEEQLHVTEDDVKNTLGLYMLMKTKPNVKASDVFMKTGILGVDTALLSGHYIRFSVGAVPEPTYSK
jgi:aspartate/methionine/tyrosine aminotransferase